MQKRIIKAQQGSSGLNIEEIINNYTQEQLHKEPTNFQKVVQGIDYVLNPYGAISDYIQKQDWAPEWLKQASPYIVTAISFIGGKPKRPNRGFNNRSSYLQENGMNQTGNSPRFDQRQRAKAVHRDRGIEVDTGVKTKAYYQAEVDKFKRLRDAETNTNQYVIWDNYMKNVQRLLDLYYPKYKK